MSTLWQYLVSNFGSLGNLNANTGAAFRARLFSTWSAVTYAYVEEFLRLGSIGGLAAGLFRLCGKRDDFQNLASAVAQ